MTLLRACHLLNLSVGALVLTACGASQTVERRHGEEIEAGRHVPPAGYAYYAQAVFLEQRGELNAAREAYRKARSADPKSGAVWAGLARTYCKTDRLEAGRLFARGLDRAEERFPIYLARSECALGWGDAHAAIQDARTALLLGPDRVEATEAVARAAERLGDERTANATRRAYRLYLGLPPEAEEPEKGLALIDRALARQDLEMAQSHAAGVLPPGELALRALALGVPELARQQAELVLGASPDDPNALTAQALLEPRTVGWTPSVGVTLSPLAACLFAGHLAAWAGTPAAALFLRRLPVSANEAPPALSEWQKSADPLVRECADHVAGLIP